MKLIRIRMHESIDYDLVFTLWQTTTLHYIGKLISSHWNHYRLIEEHISIFCWVAHCLCRRGFSCWSVAPDHKKSHSHWSWTWRRTRGKHTWNSWLSWGPGLCPPRARPPSRICCQQGSWERRLCPEKINKYIETNLKKKNY